MYAQEEDEQKINSFRKKELEFRKQKIIVKKKKNQEDEETLENFLEKHSGSLIDTRKIMEGDAVEKITDSVFEVKRNPGLIIIPRAISTEMQMDWMIQAIHKFPLAPYSNITNLGNNPSDLWNSDFSAFKKLRWVNLGYSYDWTHRKYKISEEPNSQIPVEISEKLIQIAVEKSKTCESFKPETAIVNYYYLDSSMGPHVDDAEFDLSRPVISVSLGASAVFLIGGVTKDIEPSALLLHSGDVVILSGKSRDCFHAVPRILPCSIETRDSFLQVIDQNLEYSKQEKEKLLNFIQQTRININVRQIFESPNSKKD